MKMCFVNIHTHKSTNQDDVIEICNHYKIEEVNHTRISAGLHPWYLPEHQDKAIHFLRHYSQHNSFVALGEVGLDKKVKVALNKQVEFFELSLEFANKNNIGVIIIHCVKALDEVVSLIKKNNYQGFVIFHDFHSSVDQCQKLLVNPNFYFSLGKVLHRPKSKLFPYLSKIPLQRIFLETDDNEISIQQQYEAFSLLTGHDIVDIKYHLYHNYLKLFGAHD